MLDYCKQPWHAGIQREERELRAKVPALSVFDFIEDEDSKMALNEKVGPSSMKRLPRLRRNSPQAGMASRYSTRTVSRSMAPLLRRLGMGPASGIVEAAQALAAKLSGRILPSIRHGPAALRGLLVWPGQCHSVRELSYLRQRQFVPQIPWVDRPGIPIGSIEDARTLTKSNDARRHERHAGPRSGR